MDYEDAADVFENISEGQIHVWRTLIELVKSNCILYQKKLKGYSKKTDKSLMWTNIGKLLVPPMTGIEAEKIFYRLRQKFGKERRKVIQSQARSGAGADHMPYKSDWILYDDLLFLADHIQPRR
ncbi:uncharacterized protein LOC115232765 [Formica exsecta]|uniref:uncharacterized protein LOC115232765 n=1 Tax=Formica exsecta TaxID=72781 RepID=UPI001144B061|nr:uncharacterized protein LOC115232765 [Formica exsecta]